MYIPTYIPHPSDTLGLIKFLNQFYTGLWTSVTYFIAFQTLPYPRVNDSRNSCFYFFFIIPAVDVTKSYGKFIKHFRYPLLWVLLVHSELY